MLLVALIRDTVCRGRARRRSKAFLACFRILNSIFLETAEPIAFVQSDSDPAFPVKPLSQL